MHAVCMLCIEISLVLITRKELVLMTFTRRWYASLLIFLAEPLCNLFANSPTAVAPTDWRLAIICPIHKEGDPEDVSNYRPSLFYNMYNR